MEPGPAFTVKVYLRELFLHQLTLIFLLTSRATDFELSPRGKLYDVLRGLHSAGEYYTGYSYLYERVEHQLTLIFLLTCRATDFEFTPRGKL